MQGEISYILWIADKLVFNNLENQLKKGYENSNANSRLFSLVTHRIPIEHYLDEHGIDGGGDSYIYTYCHN